MLPKYKSAYWNAEKEAVVFFTGGIREGFTEKLTFVLGLEEEN